MLRKLFKFNITSPDKRSAELKFWEGTLKQYISWYKGDLKILYGEKSPKEKDKIYAPNTKDRAILTWEKIHQQPKYLEDLQLTKNIFKGKNLLDIGAGPHPSAKVFTGCRLYCLDPLYPQYCAAGFPLHYYEDVSFVIARAENIPLPDKSIDAVISVNALDHVDDFEATALEIKRVLKRGGKLRFHLHYHRSTTEEPIELTDVRVSEAYSWCKNFRKISESRRKRGTTLEDKDEKYVLWSNI